jgi:hypothetical protein
VAVSALLTAILSPILGAGADRAGARKRFLAMATALCIGATTLLGFVPPDMANAGIIALTLFVIADVSFETGYVFYNAFLPTIASPERIGRVSGYGWGLGYVGGLVCMFIALVGFVRPEVPWFGLSTEAGFNVRATTFLVAIWFLVFSIPLFLFVPERRLAGVRVEPGAALRELGRTARAIGRYREMVKFLIARLVFNDGLVTVFAFGGIYAARRVRLRVRGRQDRRQEDDRRHAGRPDCGDRDRRVGAHPDVVLDRGDFDRTLRRTQSIGQPLAHGPFRSGTTPGGVLRVLRLLGEGDVIPRSAVAGLRGPVGEFAARGRGDGHRVLLGGRDPARDGRRATRRRGGTGRLKLLG